MPAEIVSIATFVFKLGVEVWKAIEGNERHKTVGEIFDSVPRDEATIAALREDARKFYEAKP